MMREREREREREYLCDGVREEEGVVHAHDGSCSIREEEDRRGGRLDVLVLVTCLCCLLLLAQGAGGTI